MCECMRVCYSWRMSGGGIMVQDFLMCLVQYLEDVQQVSHYGLGKALMFVHVRGFDW